MTALGFNLLKGELHLCALRGTRAAPCYVGHDRHRFDPGQPRPELARFFKLTFGEVIRSFEPDRLAYRLTLNAKSADQVAYLCFPFGILNLIGSEKQIPTSEFTTPSFSKKALKYAAADKLAACDAMISGFPPGLKEPAKLAALAAWMSLDV